MAASDYTSLVQQFYVGFYGRPADADGLKYWSERVDFFNGDFTSVLNAFASSDEAQEYVYTNPDTGDKYTNTELVENVYQDLFGRAADAEGLAFYVGKLDSGDYTVQDVVKRVIDGAQGDDSTVLANKVKVAEYFTDNLGDATYGSDDIADARAVLSDVEADDASVLAALDLADSTIEEMGGGAGETFTLTVSSQSGEFDNLTGTSGDDTFQALAFNSLEDGDLVDGKAGNDTMNARFDLSAAGATTMSLLPSVSNVEDVNVTVSKYDNSADAITLDTTNMTGLKNMVVKNDVSATAGDVLYTFDEVATGVKAGVSGGKAGADVTVNYATTTGDQAETFTVADKAVADNVIIAGIETLTVDATGESNAIADLDAAAATTLNITGSGAVAIADISTSASVKTIDASANTGGVTLGAATTTINDAVTSVTGGSGDDKMYFTANQIAADDAIDAGEGTDTVYLLGGSLGSAHAALKGFEVLGVADNSSYDLSKLTGSTITGVSVEKANGTATVSNIVGQSVSVLDDQTSLTLNAKEADTTLTLNLSNDTAKQVAGVDIADLDVSKVKTLNVTSTDANNKLGTGQDNLLGKVNAEVINLEASAATSITFESNLTKTVDGSASTAALTVTGTGGYANATSKVGMSITTGSGKDVVTGTAQNDTIVTGEGNDKVDMTAGNDNVSLGAGDDTLVIANAQFAGLTKDDTIDGGEGTDSLLITAAVAGAYDLTGASSAKLSGVTGVEKIGMDVAALTAFGNKATLQIDDATLSVANNALTLTVADSASAAHAGAIAAFDASSVVLSQGTIALDASDFGSILQYAGGNAAETITGGAKDDVFVYATSAYLAAADTLNGGEGADTLVLAEAAAKTITAEQLSGLTSIGTINLDGVTAANTNAISITLSNAVATSMAESNALSVVSLNALGNVDDTGKITIDGSAVESGTNLTLSGALGADTIKGGAGDDVITGGNGADKLTGGEGKDDFAYVGSETGGPDTITDFDFGTSTTSVDQIKVTTGGTWAANAVSKASDVGALADARIVILDQQTYADVTALNTATTTGGGDVLDNGNEVVVIWQDSLGSVHATYDSNGSTTGGQIDLAIFDDVTITGIASLIDTGDFVLA